MRKPLIGLVMAAIVAVLAATIWILTPGVGADIAAPAAPDHHIGAIWPCSAFKPHTGDPAPWFAAWNNETNPYVDTADCATTHPGGTDHIYCVVEWQTSPRQYTWQSGWC